MTIDLTNVLDAATERLTSGESLPAILADYPAQAEALKPLLNTVLTIEAIRPVEIPPLEALQADRNEFLANIATMQQQPVSTGPLDRLKAWIVYNFSRQSANSVYQRKEQRRMSTLLIKAMLALTLVFGSTGGAAAVAANSLPGSPVYPLKLTLEQAQLSLASNPAGQANVHLGLAQTRVREMERLALAGIVPDKATMNRLQQHLNQTFTLAAQLPDEEMLGLLTQTRQMAQTEEQQTAQTQTQVSKAAQEPLRQANQLLNQVRQDAEAGLQDPLTFRQRFGQNRPEDAPVQPVVEPPNPAPPEERGNSDCPAGDCEPAGDANQHGQEADAPGGPNGDQDCGNDCEPNGDQNQHGQEVGTPGGPNSDQDCGNDCDQNGHGQETDAPVDNGENGNGTSDSGSTPAPSNGGGGSSSSSSGGGKNH